MVPSIVLHRPIDKDGRYGFSRPNVKVRECLCTSLFTYPQHGR